jgi:hypothetical protein
VAVGPREIVTGHPSAALVQVFPRAPIVGADFEDGTAAGFNNVRGNVEVVSPGLGDTDYALAVTVDGSSKRSFVRARRPKREPTVSLAFDLAGNRVDLGDRQLDILTLYGPGRDFAKLTLEPKSPTSSQYRATLWAWDASAALDGSGDWRRVGRAQLPPAQSVRLGVEWRAASGPGARNGRVRLLRNGRVKGGLYDLDSDRQVINGLVLGLPYGSLGAAGGSFLVDEIELHR